MAIIMQCHRNPEQVNKIIDFFNDDEFDIYIHVDKKSNIKDYIKKNNNVTILNNSIDVRWARYSQVEATISLLRKVKEQENIYKYIHFISGQDYPVKSLEYIKNKFNNSKSQYIDYFSFPNNDLVKKGYDRYEVYYPQWMIDRPNYLLKKILRVSYREFILFTKIFKRDLSSLPRIYGGSCWFSITGECGEYILNYIDKNPQYIKFFKNSIYADEMFFQTIILNSKYKK
ncbi:N-acetylglucosaminyltransferase, partial [Clostridium saudiense]|nr:N-acetylglucosaminyltransferase [Clostridium saudiense]